MAAIAGDQRFIRDDLAYILPMGVFLLFTQAGASWPALYPATYVAKTLLVAVLLVWLWPKYTRIRWNGWYLGAALGVVGVVQWIVIQHWLERHFPWPIFRPDPEKVFDPTRHFASSAARWAFIGVRIGAASLLVPVMEELFWRDFAWRTIAAPNDFKLAKVGEWDWRAFVIVPLIFAAVHGNWWLTAVVWAFMIGGLLLWTRSLGACIVMHAVTNLLLGLYVLRTGEWAFW
jgi:CAAX prenyl protease-like protein